MMRKNKFDSMEDFMREFKNHEYKVVVLCGLPGSGKSTLGKEISEENGCKYISSDKARVEVMKLTKGKFAKDGDEYLGYRERVYEWIQNMGMELVDKGSRVIFDATHLNDNRTNLLKRFKEYELGRHEVLVVLVDGGQKENIKQRISKKKGENGDGRSWVEAWETAYDWFVENLEQGIISAPTGDELGYKFVTVRNH